MFRLVNPIENIAAARLLEFLAERKPWYRSLWGIGVILAMEELHEACAAMRQGHLSEASIKRMISSLQKRAGKDPGFTEADRTFLRQQLQNTPRAEGVTHYGIRELSKHVSSHYLTRWGQAIVSGNFTVEHFARSVAAYMLDAGFAAQYLHKFIKDRLNTEGYTSLSQLCDALKTEMLASPRREFEVLLAFASPPASLNGIPSAWLQGAAVIAWLKAHGFDTAGVRSPAAMILHVQARDAFGAATAARNEVDRYSARALIATGKPLDCLPTIWVKGSNAAAPLKEASQGVGVKELFREDCIFSTGTNQSMDAALELLAHMEGSSPTAAVAGGWAAIEGLLADPSDRASAAGNLATLVTCSFPRAELTALSHKAQRNHPEICHELEEARSNRERCHILARMIIDGRMPMMPGLADQAAVARIKELLTKPSLELQTIRDEIGDSFHRLYRQRNLILHGARLDSVALTASLRTVAKLVGAGMDRITHGHYVQNLKPLELVAKANLALALIKEEPPLRCVELLEADEATE